MSGSKVRLVSLLALTVSACSPQPSLHYDNGAFIAEGVGAEPAGGWAAVFHVSAGDSSDPLLGEYRRDGSRVIFTPRFAPSAGVALHASLRGADGKEQKLDISLPSPALSATTRVEAIEPSSDTWPANTLRMYVTFSSPMRVGEAWTHIRILDPSGKAIEKPFVEIEQELWDPTARRLTVLFDPGRIKRGLVDNETAGPPLAPGRDVTIAIDPTWRDARGAPLAGESRRTIHVSPAERRPLATGEWMITAPQTERGVLRVAFGRPLDHALALRSLSVTGGDQVIRGRAELSEGDTVWTFTPEAPWSRGAHELVVDGVLEDIAGNRLGKAFDVDLADPKAGKDALPSARRSFEVRY